MSYIRGVNARRALLATVRPFREDDFEPVIELWHRTKRDAYPYLPLEQSRTLDEDRAFFRTSILARCRVFVCEAEGAIRGFVAVNGSYMDRLYVDPSHQRRGIGSALMAEALHLSPEGIELHTHQVNATARAFYEKHGFVAVAFGLSPPPESAPDVEYRRRPAARPR